MTVTSLRSSLVVLDGVTTADGVSVATPPAADDDRAVSAADRVLPVPTELASVLPWGGLRRGGTVAIHGSTALLFALLSEASARGSWAAVVGLPDIGLAAASETGVVLSRTAVVPYPGEQPAKVVAALLDGVDLVAAHPRHITDADARRLSTRARHRGSVLLPLGAWPGADISLHCSEARWHGLGNGHGYLREREVTVVARGRGAAARGYSHRLLLPGRSGSTGAVEHDAPTRQSERETHRRLRPVAG